MRLLSLLLATPFFIIGCSTPSSPPPVEEKPAPIIKQNFANILESNFRGQFSFAEGKGSFKACNSNEEFSVDANSTVIKIYEQISPSPSTPVYIEFTGEFAFPDNKKQQSDVIMRIDRVHHMALARASLQCEKPIDTFLFKASGDEPYWRLSIDNEQLFFSTKASNQAYDVEDADFRTTQINTITTTNKKGQRLKLKIEPGHCYNTNNKEYWGYTAGVDSVWGEYSGCGEPGWPIEDQLFTGYYLNTTSNAKTNLILSDNFTAEYKENINGKEVTKTGYWKTNSPERVVVMLTREGENKLQQELIFKRQGLTLSVDAINKDKVITRFKEPLTFNKMNAQEGNESTKVDRINRAFTAQNISPNADVDIEIQKAVNDYFKIHRTDPKDTKFSAVKYDLNGNGIEDAIVLLDWCSAKNGCEMLIFEGRAEGYRFSSRVSRIHAPIVISKTQHYLWQSLLIKQETNWSLLNFDGLSYPIHTRDLTAINKADYATDVILFNEGKPTKWFPIKM